jgi:hypothetical protein
VESRHKASGYTARSDQPALNKTVAGSSASVVDLPFADEPLWLLANRLAASKGFVKSRFLTNFILHICTMHLAGRSNELTEQRIGEEVFERPPGYRPGDDNIVRNYARLLRQRLDEYFEGEGRDEPLRIVVPRGGYIPLCIERNQAVELPSAEAAPLPLSPPTQSSSTAQLPAPLVTTPADAPRPSPWEQRIGPESGSSGKRWLLVSLCFTTALCVALCVALAVLLLRAPQEKSQPRLVNLFWRAFFSPNRDTLIIPADSGLGIYQQFVKQWVHLPEYASGEYEKTPSVPPGMAADILRSLGDNRYTSFVDLRFVVSLAQLPEVRKDRLKLRFAREASLDELKQSTVILIGSTDSNPWVELFQKGLNFQLEHWTSPDRTVIHNLHPAAGEREFYATDHNEPTHSTYGLIAVTPSLDGAGYVLLIEGINMAGTGAAADFLFSPAMNALLPQIIDKKGNIEPFEILLKTGNIGANAASPQAVAVHISGHRSS